MSTNSTATVPGQHRISQYVTFRVQEQTYAFRIDQIREIVILQQVTRIPQVPACVEGVANLRGAIIPIIQLRVLFGLPAIERDAEARVIVVQVGERLIGCLVDSVTQVVRIDQEDIRIAPETVTGYGAAYIAGFARVHEQLVVLLDIDELLDPKKLEVARDIRLDVGQPPERNASSRNAIERNSPSHG